MYRSLVGIVSLAVMLSACDPAPEPGDVGIRNLEFTQGIQNIANQVPLLAEKPTFVRVYVLGNTEGGASVPTVTATMTVDEGSPIASSGTLRVTPPADGSDWRALNDSFLFQIPEASLTEGSHHVRIELVLPAGATVSSSADLVVETDITFQPPISATMWGIRYGYNNVPLSYQQRLGLSSSTWEPRPFSDFEPQRDGAEQMLPLSHLTITELPNTPPIYIDCAYVGDPQTGGCSGYVQGRAWGQQTIDAAFPGGGETVVVMQPEGLNGHYGAQYFSPATNSVINFQRDGYEIGATLGHELYHSFDVFHTQTGLDFPEADYPRYSDGALGPYVGLRSRPFVQLIPGDNAAGAVTAYDIMSYRFPQWPSPYTWCKAMNVATDGTTTCPPNLDGWRP